MVLQKILLKDFRNFGDKLLEFDGNGAIIVGPNASGKTNILESIFLLAIGKSFKAHVEEEMINYDAEIGRVKGRSGENVLEVVLTRGIIGKDLAQGMQKRAARKKFLVNKVGKRMADFTEHFNAVLFTPQDMDLVTASPSLRRKFLDTLLSQTDTEYKRSVVAYEKGLRRRNKLLLKIREEGIPRTVLSFWDKLLIKNGNYIGDKRQEFVDFLSLDEEFGDKSFHVEYDKSAISEERLENYEREEVAAATTLVGPHRDDIIFKIKNDGPWRALDSFGSRGEQRMAVLWVKLNELEFIEKETGERPTLLLDDIFSELDEMHRQIVRSVITKQQTIMTTADPHYVADFKDFAVIVI